MRHDVSDADTALIVGSGDLPVLSTARLVAWMEAATIEAAAPFITTGQTTVGTAIRIEHLRPTRVGGRVEVSAEPRSAGDERRLTFFVLATDGSGEKIATGEIDRAIVDRERFLSSVPEDQGPRNDAV